MKIRTVTTALLTLAATAAFAAGKDFDRTLNITAAPAVSIFSGAGYIHVHPGSDNQVHIIGHVRPSNSWFSNNSDARIQQIVSNPPITQSGNNIAIGDTHSNDLFHDISIDYDVTLPRASNIRTSSGSGSIEIQDAGASLKADSGSGSVSAHGIHGPADLRTGSGSIDLEETTGSDVRAHTGSGTIHLRGLSGGLQASTGSGSIEANGQPAADWKLQTGSGSINLGLGSSAHYTLNASTGPGTIRTTHAIAMQGEINKHHVTGTVNGGGPTIQASTGSGSIDIN